MKATNKEIEQFPLTLTVILIPLRHYATAINDEGEEEADH